MALRGVGPRFLKHAVFSLNLLLCVSGLVLASAMGLLALRDAGGANGRGSAFVVPAAVGGAMAFVGGLGCLGSARESEGLLLAFVACLLVLFACELSASRWACRNGPTLAEETKAFYDSLYDMAADTKYVGRSSIASGARRLFHGTLNCCGKTAATRDDDDVCPRTGGRHAVSCHERVKDLVRVPSYFVSAYSLAFGVIAFAMSCGMPLCLLCTTEAWPEFRQRGDVPGTWPQAQE